jgi:hypothetical protein
MPKFIAGTEVVTDTPTVEVSADSGLKPGRHWFRLVVEDDSGNLSQPEFASVIVLDRSAPTAIFQLAQSEPPLAEQPFSLDASESRDLGGGRIAHYHWTVLPQEETP